MIYAYRHPDPLNTAQNYSFSLCNRRDFIAAWRKERRDVKQRLASRTCLPEPPDPATVPPSGTLSLSRLMESEEGFWTLIRKFEVFGRLFNAYQANLHKHPDATPATIYDYLTFGEKLVECAEQTDVLQYLSTLLKLLDALGALPPDIFAGQAARRLTDLIDAEARLVARVETGLVS